MLTPAQRATLKTDVLANGDTTALYNAGNLAGLADIYNLNAVPSFWAWRTRVKKTDFTNSTSVDGTTFNWTGAGYIGRSAGEQNAWRDIFDENWECNPSQPNVRQAFTDIFSGATVPAPANRTHLATIARRLCSRFEKVFTTGTGTTVTPGLLVVEGPVDYQEFIGL